MEGFDVVILGSVVAYYIERNWILSSQERALVSKVVNSAS